MNAKQIVVRLFAPVNETTVSKLMEIIDQKMKKGVNEFKILISSPGGSVQHGLSAYNYLKGIPAKITTHNFGIVDSIAILLYCSGQKRLCVPQARFLLHTTTYTISRDTKYEEKQLEEILKRMRIDIENIAKVIADNTNKNVEEIKEAIYKRTTLSPEEAKEWGLVHEIESKLFEVGSEVVSIDPAQFKKM